jgi:hypothetical protein
MFSPTGPLHRSTALLIVTLMLAVDNLCCGLDHMRPEAAIEEAQRGTNANNDESCHDYNPRKVDTGSSGPYFDEVTVERESDGEVKNEVFRVYMVTYANDLHRWEYCIMAASAAANGFRLNVLGEGRADKWEQHGYLDKFWAVKEFVDGITAGADRRSLNRSIIFFVDAYDVLITGTPKMLVLRMLKSGKKVLFSSERGCCGTREEGMYKRTTCASDEEWVKPEYDTATPYLNSGVYVGFVREVAYLLQAAFDEWTTYTAKIEREIGPLQPIHKMPPESKGPWDPYIILTDQLLACHLVSRYVFPAEHRYDGKLARQQLKIGLDYNSKLFLSAYQMAIDGEISFTKTRRVAYNGQLTNCLDRFSSPGYSEMCRRWKANKPPVTFPIALHFNGRGIEKEKMRAVASRMAWPDIPQAALWNHTTNHQPNGSSNGDHLARRQHLKLQDQCAMHLSELACGDSVGDCLAQHR